MTRKDKRRHPKYWPNVVKDAVMMLELRQPNPASSERKPNRILVTTKSGGVDPSPPSKCKLPGGDNVSRAAQSRGLNVFKVAHQGGRPHFEFYCAKTGAMVFGFFPRTSNCTFDISSDGARSTKSMRVKNIFHAIRIVSCRNDVIARGRIEQPWKSPTREKRDEGTGVVFTAPAGVFLTAARAE
jgi:hypothetical protein